MLQAFSCAHFRFTLEPEARLALHPRNPGNTLRGALGSTFKRLVCPTPTDCHQTCRLKTTCPYSQIFEPSPPPDSDRLSGNHDIPRPFIIRPPVGKEVIAENGAALHFDLILIGKAVDHLPYFLVTFRELEQQGLGIGRGKYSLAHVLALNRIPSPLVGEGEGEGDEAPVTRRRPPRRQGAQHDGPIGPHDTGRRVDAGASEEN